MARKLYYDALNKLSTPKPPVASKPNRGVNPIGGHKVIKSTQTGPTKGVNPIGKKMIGGTSPTKTTGVIGKKLIQNRPTKTTGTRPLPNKIRPR